jgi:hypothetical protein
MLVGTLCAGCKEQGKMVRADREVNGVALCLRHARSAAAGPVKPLEKEQPVKTAIDWDAVQKERNAGEKVTALAEKWGCSAPTICAHTVPATNKPLRSKATKAPRAAGRQARAANGNLDATIEDLKARRDKLTQAIEVLEGLES